MNDYSWIEYKDALPIAGFWLLVALVYVIWRSRRDRELKARLAGMQEATGDIALALANFYEVRGQMPATVSESFDKLDAALQIADPRLRVVRYSAILVELGNSMGQAVVDRAEERRLETDSRS